MGPIADPPLPGRQACPVAGQACLAALSSAQKAPGELRPPSSDRHRRPGRAHKLRPCDWGVTIQGGRIRFDHAIEVSQFRGMTHNPEPGDYTLQPDGVSPYYLRVLPDGRHERMRCEAGKTAYQAAAGKVVCGPPGSRLLSTRVFPIPAPDEPEGGDLAGDREPRSPVPPSPHLRGAQNIPPDSDPVSLPGIDH